MNVQKKMTPRLVANDNGYAAHKIAWVGQKGEILVKKIPTLIQAGGSGFASAQGDRIGAYEVEGIEYHCSPIVSNPMSLRNSDYPTSVANRVLFNHALAKAGLIGMPVKAAVTLPFRDYFNADGTVNTELCERVGANFSQRNVTIVGSEAQPDVGVPVRVYAEALSAWFDWALNDDGSMSPAYQELSDMDGQMLVVDIGGSTTDIASVALVDGSLLINHEKSGTERVGVLDAMHKLEELVRSKLQEAGVSGLDGHGGKIPAKVLEMIMEKGQCQYGGKKWDFTFEMEAACHGVADRITNYIKSTVGSSGDYYAILIVGGGSIVFRHWIQAVFSNAIFGDEFSNARGALKYLRGE